MAYSSGGSTVIGREVRDIGVLEAQAGAGKRAAPGQHGLRVVNAQRLTGLQLPVQQLCQLTCATAEVDDTHGRLWLHQRQQVVEGLAALGPKPLVLLRIPVLACLSHRSILSWHAAGSPPS